ncbi:zinc ribbon domain-containing protein, partial [Bacillus cereus]
WLSTKCREYGIELRQADRFYPSSKMCSCCGQKKSDLKLSDRVALYTVLQKDIAVDGFIFMAPWLPEIEEWNELLGVLQDKHI